MSYLIYVSLLRSYLLTVIDNGQTIKHRGNIIRTEIVLVALGVLLVWLLGLVNDGTGECMRMHATGDWGPLNAMLLFEVLFYDRKKVGDFRSHVWNMFLLLAKREVT